MELPKGRMVELNWRGRGGFIAKVIKATVKDGSLGSLNSVVFCPLCSIKRRWTLHHTCNQLQIGYEMLDMNQEKQELSWGVLNLMALQRPHKWCH
jgi:hypothetical protein